MFAGGESTAGSPIRYNLDVAERREAEVTGTSTHRRQNTGIREEAKERVRGHEVYVFCE